MDWGLVVSESEGNVNDDQLVENRERWSLDAYRCFMLDARASLAMLPHLLRTVSYVFGDTHGQVVPMMLHRTAERNLGGEDAHD